MYDNAQSSCPFSKMVRIISLRVRVTGGEG